MSHAVSLAAMGAALAVAAVAAPFDRPTYNPGGYPWVLRHDGAAQRIGNGPVRTYVLTDASTGGKAIEVGVAISADAMEGLRGPKSAEEMKGHEHEHMDTDELLLELPEGHGTPYQFVQFNWNPSGHEPPGVWDLAHFDFHFYTVPLAVRDQIVPANPEFELKAARYPDSAFRAPFYVDAAAAARVRPALATVPKMGLHWLDVRSPELQGLTGHPERFQPFTRTFIYGSWDGQFIFDEPMITRGYLLSKRDAADPALRDEIIPVSTAARRDPARVYPRAYRITYDERAGEYRVALTQLTWQ
jgi:hypothetical protein